jgi:hypothetical protein
MHLRFMLQTIRAHLRGSVIGVAIVLSVTAGVLAQTAPLVDAPAVAPVVAEPAVVPTLVDAPALAQVPIPPAPPLVDPPKLLDAPKVIDRGDAVMTGFSGVQTLKPDPGSQLEDLLVIDAQGLALQVFDLSQMFGPDDARLVQAPRRHTVPAARSRRD